MAAGGYIKLWRGWRDCPELDTAVHRDAWVWMLETACWKPTRFKVGGKFIVLERGQLCASVRQIADAAGCSKSAADRFLTRLENGTMIVRNAGHFKNVITICNYGKYQDLPDDERDKSGTVGGTRAGQERDTKEESKKVKKEEKDISPNGDCASDDALVVDDVFSFWNDKAPLWGKSSIRDKTPERRQLVKARIAQHGLEGWREMLANFDRSDFLREAKGIQFDWIIKKGNFQKVLEGNYNG